MSEKTGLIMNLCNTVYFTCSPVQAFGGSSGWCVRPNPNPAYSQIGTSFQTAVINSSGQLWVSGWNGNGRLGNNSTVQVSSPVQTIAGGTNWRNLSVSRHSLATKTDGTLWAWGVATFGRLGNNNTVGQCSPVQTISGGTNWRQVSAGEYMSLATKTDGTLWTWGAESNGKLGNNATAINRSSPVQTVSAVTTWAFGVSGEQHAAAIKNDGTLWLWGRNAGGRLGNNDSVSRSSPVQTISGGTNWCLVDAMASATVAIKTDNSLWNWGLNYRGDLGIGIGTFAERSSPVQTISGGTNWRTASGGCYRVGAIKTDGTLWFWGQNEISFNIGVVEFGKGEFIRILSSPTQTIIGGTDWHEVTNADTDWQAGGGWMAIKTNGTIWGSGYIGSGEKGNNYTANIIETERDLGDLFVWKDCFTDSGLWVSGSALAGVLGSNGGSINRSSPVQTISGGSNWKEISVGGSFASSIKTDGTLWMWGNNNRGQIGDNTLVVKSSPVQTISGGTNWRKVSLGSEHSASIKTDGSLWTWGFNRSTFNAASGQLGNNDTTTSVSSPIQTISGGTNWKTVNSGRENLGSIKTDGTLWVWGYNFGGYLGDNTSESKSSPVQTIAGGTNWKDLRSGVGHMIALKTDGTLWTWGYNRGGALGDDTTISKSSPVQTVSSTTNWKIPGGAGGGHSVAIKTDASLWTWGCNFDGELGNNSTAARSSPVQTISGGTNWKNAFTTGNTGNGCNGVIAIKTDGTLWGWGENTDGVLGINATASRSSPVQTVSATSGWKCAVTGIILMALREDCW